MRRRGGRKILLEEQGEKKVGKINKHLLIIKSGSIHTKKKKKGKSK